MSSETGLPQKRWIEKEAWLTVQEVLNVRAEIHSTVNSENNT